MSSQCYRHLLDGLPDARASETTLAFSGFGEPMAHPAFLDMIELARARDFRVEVTTNGTFLDARMARDLVVLGVSQVAVSVDGGTETAHAAMRSGPLAPILAGIVALREARRTGTGRLRLGIACVATRQNVGTLPALIAMANDLHLDFLSISGLVPHTAELEQDALWDRAAFAANSEPAAYGPRLAVARMDSNDRTAPLIEAIGRQQPVIPPLAFDNGASRHHCRFAHEGVLAVASDGRVAPCLSLLYTHPEYVNRQRRLVHAFSLASVDVRPLLEIWRDPSFRRFRRRLRTFDFPFCFDCGPCPLTEENQEDCYGSPFPACGMCLWAQGIVLCP